MSAAAFTAAEIAFVLREPVRTVKKALDGGPVRAKLAKRAGLTVRIVDWTDLLYLFVVRTLREELTPKARVQLHDALRRLPVEHVHEVRFGWLTLTIDALRAEVRTRERDLARLAERVEFRRDGEPMLKGTGVEVYRIAALLGGMTPRQILEDWPSLTPDAIEIARAYAEAHPKVGRPFAATTT